MAKRFRFHGAFASAKDAKERAKSVGGKVKTIRVRGMTRHAVVSEK